VPQKDAHWLRVSSVFTLARGVLGNTNIRAFTGIPTDPPLPDGAERKVLAGDAKRRNSTAGVGCQGSGAELDGTDRTGLTVERKPGQLSGDHRETQGPHGALGVLLGNDKDAGKLLAALDRTNALLARVDGMAAKADTQVFGTDGVMSETHASIVQLGAMLGDAREP